MVHVQIFVWSHYAIFVDGKESGTSSLVSSRLLEWPIGSVTMSLISSTWMDTSTEEIRIFHGILTPWPDRDKSNDKKKIIDNACQFSRGRGAKMNLPDGTNLLELHFLKIIILIF
jgi:hypothetical protein